MPWQFPKGWDASTLAPSEKTLASAWLFVSCDKGLMRIVRLRVAVPLSGCLTPVLLLETNKEMR